jgi:hypothetical protein
MLAAVCRYQELGMSVVVHRRREVCIHVHVYLAVACNVAMDFSVASTAAFLDSTLLFRFGFSLQPLMFPHLRSLDLDHHHLLDQNRALGQSRCL